MVSVGTTSIQTFAMTSIVPRAVRTAAFAVAIVAAPAVSAQDGGRGLFGGIFSPDQRPPQPVGQANDVDLIVRIDRLERQLRELTGAIEQLQYRNQQLDQLVKRLQEDTEFRFQELGSKGAARTPAPPVRPQPPAALGPLAPARRSDALEPNDGLTAGTGRRSDAFDPAANPNAPGAPRVLGSLPGAAGRAQTAAVDRTVAGAIGARGAPGGGPRRLRACAP